MKKVTVLTAALCLAFLTSKTTFAQDGAKPTEKKEEHKEHHEAKKEEHKEHHEEKKAEHMEKKEEHKEHHGEHHGGEKH